MATSSVAPSSGRKYTSSGHAVTVTDGFKRLWDEASLCDTQLVVQGQTFHVHRAFLATCSQYFYLMFTKDFQEKSKNKVELKGVTSIGMRAILQFAYTGSVVINDANLQDVLQAADHLEFEEIRIFCSQFIRAEIQIDNCLKYLAMADLYELTECKADTKAFILDNFVPVASNDDFYNVSEEVFCEYLADDRLKAHSELDVFHIALTWLETVNSSQAVDVNRRILELIRYGLMTEEEMEEIYYNHLLLTTCHEVHMAATEYHVELLCQPLMTCRMSRIRASRESVVIFGGAYLDDTLVEDVLAAPVLNGHLQPFSSLHATPFRRVFATIASVNDFVFVIGGQTSVASDGKEATNTAYRYNPRNGAWLQLSSMQDCRTNFALIAFDTCLVAVGGMGHFRGLTSAEKYDFASNDWTSIADVPHTLFSHAGCSNDSRVFISGGCSGAQGFTGELLAYDMQQPGWTFQTPMTQSRGFHAMVAHADRLFVCGGNTNVLHRRDVMVTESYNIALNEWTILAPPLYGQSEAPAILCDNKIFIVGGYSWNEDTFHDTVHVYDIEQDTWDVAQHTLSKAMRGVVACNLKVPQRLFDDLNVGQ